MLSWANFLTKKKNSQTHITRISHGNLSLSDLLSFPLQFSCLQISLSAHWGISERYAAQRKSSKNELNWDKSTKTPHKTWIIQLYKFLKFSFSYLFSGSGSPRESVCVLVSCVLFTCKWCVSGCFRDKLCQISSITSANSHKIEQFDEALIYSLNDVLTSAVPHPKFFHHPIHWRKLCTC